MAFLGVAVIQGGGDFSINNKTINGNMSPKLTPEEL